MNSLSLSLSSLQNESLSNPVESNLAKELQSVTISDSLQTTTHQNDSAQEQIETPVQAVDASEAALVDPTNFAIKHPLQNSWTWWFGKQFVLITPLPSFAAAFW